jgi:hypothetical protein
MDPKDLAKGSQAGVKRFRILVIGNANAGKTTILDKVCHANGRNPEILGKRVRYMFWK